MAEQVNITIADSTAQVNISVESGGGVSKHSELTLDDGTNPHGTTKTDVGLSNILNVDLTPAVDLNTAKVGITTAQASDITANNSKISYTDSSAVSLNTAKIGITSTQASDITSNNAKVSYTDSVAVALNTAKISYAVNPFTGLTDATNISWDTRDNDNATVLLAGNRTLDNPTNLINGKSYNLIVRQDATGSRTLAYGGAFIWSDGTVPTLSTGANEIDVFTFIYDGSKLYGSLIKNFS